MEIYHPIHFHFDRALKFLLTPQEGNMPYKKEFPLTGIVWLRNTRMRSKKVQ